MVSPRMISELQLLVRNTARQTVNKLTCSCSLHNSKEKYMFEPHPDSNCCWSCQKDVYCFVQHHAACLVAIDCTISSSAKASRL